MVDDAETGDATTMSTPSTLSTSSLGGRRLWFLVLTLVLLEQGELGTSQPRRTGKPQVAEGLQRQDTAARRAPDESLLQEVGFDDVFQRVARLRQCRRQSLDADRPAFVVLGDAGEVAVIEGVEAFAVHLELPERAIGQ